MELTYEEYQLLLEKIETVKEENAELKSLIAIFRKNIPYIYRQTVGTTHADGIFEVSIPLDHIISDTVIYFLPYEAGVSLTESITKNILRIKQGTKVIGDYTFVKESLSGVMSNVGLGVIVPNRTLMLRLIHSNVSKKRAVVINSSLENEISTSVLNVLGSALFKELPSLEIEGEDPDTLAKGSVLNQLRADFDTFKGDEIAKFKVGTEEASVALENEPVGTLYIRMGDDYVTT